MDNQYEVLYLPAPKSLYYDPRTESTAALREAGQKRRDDDAHALMVTLFEGLLMRVSSDLQAPVKFRWINPQGKLVWSGSSRTINGTFRR